MSLRRQESQGGHTTGALPGPSRSTSSAPRAAGPRAELVLGLPDARLLAEWTELAAGTSAPCWVAPGWVVPWWKHMARGRPGLVVVRSGRGSLRAVLPVQRKGPALLSATNWHTPEYSVVAEDKTARRQVVEAALTLAGSRLTLDFVDDTTAADVQAITERSGGRSLVRHLESSPHLPLDGGWQDRLDRHVLAELGRRRRRLEERGEVSFEVADGSSHLDALLHQGFRVEASGWKGRTGSAIACSPSTESFYRELATWAAGAGLLRLCFLRLDGVALAFDFSIEERGVHSLLKTGFDEGARSFGPGKLLRLHVLQDCVRRDVRQYEFLGTPQDWKREWTSYERRRLRVHAFPAGAYGALGAAVHARLRPALVSAGAKAKRRALPAVRAVTSQVRR